MKTSLSSGLYIVFAVTFFVLVMESKNNEVSLEDFYTNESSFLSERSQVGLWSQVDTAAKVQINGVNGIIAFADLSQIDGLGIGNSITLNFPNLEEPVTLEINHERIDESQDYPLRSLYAEGKEHEYAKIVYFSDAIHILYGKPLYRASAIVDPVSGHSTISDTNDLADFSIELEQQWIAGSTQVN